VTRVLQFYNWDDLLDLKIKIIYSPKNSYLHKRLHRNPDDHDINEGNTLLSVKHD